MGFAAEGARVGLLARSQAELDLAKLEIEQAGGTALRLRADVRDLEELTHAVERMRSTFGGLDVLIAAAGVQGPIGPFLSTKPKAWNETVEINLIGVANACRVALPPMIEKRSGKIILIVGRRLGLCASEFQRLRGVQDRRGALRRDAGGGSERPQRAGEHHCARRGVLHMTDEILHAGEERAGRKEIEDAEKVRVTGGIPPEKQIAAGVVSGVGAVQSHQRQTDSRERRLEALRAGEHEAGALHAAAGAEDLM